jgi:hypothetical protein
MKVEPAPGVAVSVTAVPLVKPCQQVGPQAMPAGALLTVPVPVPDLVTPSGKDDCTKLADNCGAPPRRWFRPPPPLAVENVALTACTALIVTVQVPVPVQAPFQPVNVDPVAGVAVKATAVPLANEARHVVPQEMLAGALVTVPLPVPDLVTVSENDVGSNLNVAVTEVAALIVTVHVPVPAQPPPLQPMKVEPAPGVAVSVTAVPLVKPCEQVGPQAMPVGALLTVPVPVPDLVTPSGKDDCTKLAVTDMAAVIVVVHVPVPVQPPLQPVKVEPAAGVAVSVTAVPLANAAEQVAPHEIPAGALETVPVPAPAFVMVRVMD